MSDKELNILQEIFHMTDEEIEQIRKDVELDMTYGFSEKIRKMNEEIANRYRIDEE